MKTAVVKTVDIEGSGFWSFEWKKFSSPVVQKERTELWAGEEAIVELDENGEEVKRVLIAEYASSPERVGGETVKWGEEESIVVRGRAFWGEAEIAEEGRYVGMVEMDGKNDSVGCEQAER
jgi:hypothetical protein